MSPDFEIPGKHKDNYLTWLQSQTEPAKGNPRRLGNTIILSREDDGKMIVDAPEEVIAFLSNIFAGIDKLIENKDRTLPEVEPSYYQTDLEKLELPARIVNGLGRQGINTIGDVYRFIEIKGDPTMETGFKFSTLHRVRNVGDKSINDLKKAIEEFTGELRPGAE